MSDKLQEQRIKLVADQRQLLKKADDEGRGMTVDEMAAFDKIDADIVSLKATIDRSESVKAAESRATEQRIEMAEPVETRTPETVSFAVAPKAQPARAATWCLISGRLNCSKPGRKRTSCGRSLA